MKLITLYLPEIYIRCLDELVNAQFYPNRSEAIRAAVRDLVKSDPYVILGIAELKEANRLHELTTEQSLRACQRAAELEAHQ